MLAFNRLHIATHRLRLPSALTTLFWTTVRPRFDHGSKHGSTTVQPRFDHGSTTVRTQFEHGLTTVRPRFDHGSTTVRPRFDHGSTTVCPRFDHGKYQNYYRKSVRALLANCPNLNTTCFNSFPSLGGRCFDPSSPKGPRRHRLKAPSKKPLLFGHSTGARSWLWPGKGPGRS